MFDIQCKKWHARYCEHRQRPTAAGNQGCDDELIGLTVQAQLLAGDVRQLLLLQGQAQQLVFWLQR